MIFDSMGGIVARAQEEFCQHYPKPGWVEHDPRDILSSTLNTAQAAMSQVAGAGERIAAIGLTNQRETTLLWERKSGQPLANAVVWQCRRTADICRQIKADGFDGEIRSRTGLVTDPYFSGTKLAWLLQNIPGARARAERGELVFGTVDTYLLWHLSGGSLHATDPSNASRTLLYNIHERSWDPVILNHLGIPPSLLPEVLPSSGVMGISAPGMLEGQFPLAGVAGDQQAATFGQACFMPGMAKNTYGTGCFLLSNTGEVAIPSAQGMLTTVGWQLRDSLPVYCLEGSVFIAGAAIQWLRDGLGIIPSSAAVEELASSVAGSEGVYMVPAFVGLGAPYWDPFARGSLLGLTRGTNAAHIARAALEAIAYQTRDIVDAMERDMGQPIHRLRVDGGAAANNLLMQIQADFLGIPVDRPTIPETTALGAAYLAGLAVGVWDSPQTIASNWKADRTFEPSLTEEQRQAGYHRWQAAVERSRAWAQPE
jgi:glycerol kinase